MWWFHGRPLNVPMYQLLLMLMQDVCAARCICSKMHMQQDVYATQTGQKLIAASLKPHGKIVSEAGFDIIGHDVHVLSQVMLRVWE